MIDRLPDVRILVCQLNPSSTACALRPGPSVVSDSGLIRGDYFFDLEAHLGLKRRDGSKRQFMEDFLHKLEGLKMGIVYLRAMMIQMRALKQEAVQATSPQKEKQISDQLIRLLDESNKTILKTKKKLEKLKEDNAAFSSKEPHSTESKIRDNLHAAITRKFRDILKEYQTLQTECKKDVKAKVIRQVKIVFPNATDDHVAKLDDDDGDSATAQAIRLQISGQTHETLQNAFSDIKEKYRHIRRLEQSVNDLHQMFVDLSTLVESQGELLDQIEYSVNSAKDYTDKAEKEVMSAKKAQRSAKKRMFCFTVCLMILVIVIGVPLIVIMTRP